MQTLDVHNRDILALLAVTVLILIGEFLFPFWLTRYGSYLLIFAIWMIWFVATVAQLLTQESNES
ncbi:MAG: hypothetical protein ABEI06_07665 [Halobacteriaceae archaeon]